MKKIAFILVFIVCSIVTMAQRYDNGIILQSLTDTLTRGQPI